MVDERHDERLKSKTVHYPLKPDQGSEDGEVQSTASQHIVIAIEADRLEADRPLHVYSTGTVQCAAGLPRLAERQYA